MCMKYIAVIRPTRLRTAAHQEAALAAKPFWHRTEDADEAIQMLRSGRAVLVADIKDLAAGSQQIADAVAGIHAKGCWVEDAEGRRSDIPDDAWKMGARAKRRGVPTSEEARARALKWSDKDIERAGRFWKQEKYTAAQVAELTGIPSETLYKRLGKRGTKPGPWRK